MKESYDRRLNALIHGLEESVESPWETPEETFTKIHIFLKDGLQISDPPSLAVVYYHRLPQRPLFRNETKVTRPIILKVTTNAR